MISILYRSIIALGCIALVGCGKCVYETRFVGTEGEVSVAAGHVIVRSVTMVEYRDADFSNSMGWDIQADGLSSPPKALTLRDASAKVRANLTMNSSSAVSMTASGSIETSPGDSRFGVLKSGGASVVLELENGQLITVPLSVSREEDWEHPYCD